MPRAGSRPGRQRHGSGSPVIYTCRSKPRRARPRLPGTTPPAFRDPPNRATGGTASAVVAGCPGIQPGLQSCLSPGFILNSECPAVGRATFPLGREQTQKGHFHPPRLALSPGAAFPRPRLAPAAPRPVGSRSLRPPGKGHGSEAATRGLLGRRQPIPARHPRAPANQRPSYSWVQPAPAFSPSPLPSAGSRGCRCSRLCSSPGPGPGGLLAPLGSSRRLH